MIDCTLDYGTLDYGTLSADGKRLKLVCQGIGTYDVVSGLYAFHNDVNCAFKDEAPIPPGNYYITERAPGSFRNRMQNWALEEWRWIHGVNNDKAKWFSLISVQTQSNAIIVNGRSRGAFKLHPLNSDGSGHSAGCVTFFNFNEFFFVREAILKTSTVKIRQKELGDVKTYGMLKVVGSPDFSKCNINPGPKDM